MVLSHCIFNFIYQEIPKKTKKQKIRSHGPSLAPSQYIFVVGAHVWVWSGYQCIHIHIYIYVNICILI